MFYFLRISYLVNDIFCSILTRIVVFSGVNPSMERQSQNRSVLVRATIYQLWDFFSFVFNTAIFISNILSENSTITPHVNQSLILYTICGIFFSFLLNNENYFFFCDFVLSKWYIVCNTDILHQQNTLEKYFHSTQCDPVADIVYHLWWIFYFFILSANNENYFIFWGFCI